MVIGLIAASPLSKSSATLPISIENEYPHATGNAWTVFPVHRDAVDTGQSQRMISLVNNGG
jgi:hypothetical protein